jgi:hypothetical protein
MSDVRTGLFRYLPYARLDAFLSRGWMPVADLGQTHGQWSVLGWRCDCPEEPWPEPSSSPSPTYSPLRMSRPYSAALSATSSPATATASR